MMRTRYYQITGLLNIIDAVYLSCKGLEKLVIMVLNLPSNGPAPSNPYRYLPESIIAACLTLNHVI